MSTIQVHWKFNNSARNVLGILQGFRIFYRNVNDSNGLWLNTIVYDAAARTVVLTGLEIYRDYNATVAAFTRKGHGVTSVFMLVRTDEYGEQFVYCNISLVNILITKEE